MPLSLNQLRTPMTALESYELLIEALTSLGFETTGWQDGRIEKTIVALIGIVTGDFTEVVRDQAEFGYNDLASGEALNLFSKSRFSQEKIRASRTAGPAKLTSTALIPYEIGVGELIASTSSGIEFRNTSAGTIAAGSVASPATLVLQWEARVKGSDGNVALNAINRLLTSLSGVTIANDAGTPWYTTTGVDEQSDVVMRTRNRTKWSRLSAEMVAEAYENIALEQVGVVKVRVDDTNPRGPGTIDIYVSGAADVLSDADMQVVQAAFANLVFQTEGTWVADWTGVETRAAARRPATQPLTISGTLYHEPGYADADVVSAVQAALRDFLELTPLGGWDYSPGPSNVVTLGDLLEVIEAVEGVRTFIPTAPLADVTVVALSLVTEGTWSGIVPQAVSS